MQLSRADAEQFFKLYPALLVYVNERKKILDNVTGPDNFMLRPAEERMRVRDELYEDIGLIDAFVRENPFDFASQELDIVQSWKNYLKDEFYILKHLKKHTIFLSTSSPCIAYGVLSLADLLKDMFPYPPVLVQGVLLPFKNRIVYDGYLASYNISFGGGVRRMLNNSYNEAKASYGIVTKLPFEAATQGEADDKQKLKFYLKNKDNREYYWEEIEELVAKSRDLAVTFYQEMGKVHARELGKILREIGLNNVWFGILQGLPVCSGKTKDELEGNIASVVPESQQDFVYRYHLKSKS
jgi:hypothetical protein